MKSYIYYLNLLLNHKLWTSMLIQNVTWFCPLRPLLKCL